MKLVRDRIGDFPWPDEQAKQHLGWVAPDSNKYRRLLRKKLFEEANELADAALAGDPYAVLDEAADVYEVLRALLVAGKVATPTFARQVLANAVARKLAERGGFFQGRTWSGPERAGHPASDPVNPCCNDTGFADYAAVPCPNPQCTAVLRAGEMLPQVVADAEAERLWGHPLQYAHVGRVMVNNSERMSDAEVRAAAGPAGASGLPIERTNRCPTCEQWSPCDARPPVAGPENGPASPPGSPEAGEDASAVGGDAPNAPERYQRAADPYRWQWSATGSGAWTFAGTEVNARRQAGPDGWVRRVSRLDGTPGKAERASRRAH